jgi:hypothetical protein
MARQFPIDEGYVTYVDSFDFRQIGSLKIPKRIREKAFSLSLSVRVLSVGRDTDWNYAIYPAKSFYGYATLVFGSDLQSIIPLHFGRNEVYRERNDVAYTNWESYKLFAYDAYNLSLLSQAICDVRTAIDSGVCVEGECILIPWNGFPELPLREVYIKCPYGTRFEIEVRYEIGLQFTDSCGNEVAPKSNRREDPEGNDNGLPPLGIQPSRASNPNDPYSNYPPPSSSSEQGDYYNPKIPIDGFPNSGLDNPNPDNDELPPVGTVYWVRVESVVRRTSFVGGCTNKRTDITHHPCLRDSQVADLVENDFDAGEQCSPPSRQKGWDLTLTGGQPFNVGYSDSTPSVSFGSGNLGIPADSYTFDF